MTFGRLGDDVGGIETFVRRYSRWLKAKDIDICIIHRSFILPAHIHEPANASREKSPTKRLIVGPFLFVAFGILSSILCSLMVVRANKEHHIDVIHAQGLSFGGLGGMLPSALLRIPLVVSTHGWAIGTTRSTNRPGLKTSLLVGMDEWVGRTVASRADVVLCDSETTSQKVQRYLRISADKTRITTSAVSTAMYHPPTGFPRSDQILYGYVGRFSAEKNVLSFVRAFLEARKVDSRIRLLLVGDGPLREDVRELARGSEPDIRVEGARADVRPVLSSLDVFVLPSFTEGSPIGLLEAMASGDAIIASSIAPIREIVGHGEEALLFDPTSKDSMRDAILKVAADESLRKRLSANARARAMDFDEEEVYSRLLDISRSVISH